MTKESARFLFILISLYFLEQVDSTETSCLTTSDSRKSNSKCVFPFRYKEELYDGCTDVNDKEGKLWCSTKVDQDGNHVTKQGEWGYCPTPLGNCPIATDPQVLNDIFVEDDDDDLDIRSTTSSIKQTKKACNSLETCEKRDTCSFIDEKYKAIIKAVTKSKKKPLVAQLKSLVCNKEQKAFCCPPCPSNQDCLSSNKCPDIDRMLKQLTSFRTNRNSPQYKQVLRAVRSLICNKQRRLFCCSPLSQSNIDSSQEKLSETIVPFTLPVSVITPTRTRSKEDSGTYLPPAGKCGTNPEATPSKVLGGETTSPGEFPFTVLIGYKDKCIKKVWVKSQRRFRKKNVDCIKYKCGGTLINKRYVVTAAHCHKPFGNQKIAQVVVGEWNVENDPDCTCKVDPATGEPVCSGCQAPVQKFDIGDDAVTVHKGYLGKASSFANDIALVRLDRPAQLNNGSQMVCLPVDEDAAIIELNLRSNLVDGLLDKKPTVVGWGYTSYDPFDLRCQGNFCPSGNSSSGSTGVVASKDQQKLKMPVVSTQDCEAEFRRFSPGEGQLCAGGEVGKDSCKGDSGSGLYLKKETLGSPWYQVGIVSFGSSNCGSGKPGVYTRVSHYVDWIKNNLKP